MDNLSILLIEDNQADARLIQELLREDSLVDFHIQVAPRLADGLEYLAQTDIDLVLLDLSLPDSHGLETVEQLVEVVQAIPIVVLTGLAHEEQGIWAVNLGAQDYLLKGSVDSVALVRTIRYAIQRKQTELAKFETEALRLELDKEKQISRLKESFLETVSHQFRTPLTSIISSAELIEMKADQLTSKQQDHIQKIIRASQQMNEMLNNVTAFSLMISGQWQVSPQLLDIVSFCNEKIAYFRQQAPQHRLNLTVKTDCQVLYLEGDLIAHILNNLLSNAVFYTPPGTLIELSLVCRADGVQLVVSDDGPGISVEQQEDIFKLLHRANLGELSPGMGLGLNIVRTATELHQGHVELESVPGQGTVVTVWLAALSSSNLS